jgi:MYXO-CTERM domain-containing protein
LVIAPASMAQVLLVPESGNDKVWAFNPFDGSLVSNNFIPTNANIPQPINAIDSGRGTILVTDETSDKILEFSVAGAFIGTFADASDGIDGPFGMTIYNSQVYVASTVNGRIVRFDLDGSNPTTWASGFGTPRDITFRGSDALVTESEGDDILRFDLSGASQGIWHNSDGVSGIDFPQQIQNEPNDGALVAGFTAPLGLYTYNSAGVQTNAYTNLITSPRGVYRLGNGKILYAGGTRVRIYDPSNLTEVDVVNQAGASFRFIEYSTVPAPAGVAVLGLAGLAGLRRRRA